MIQDLLNATYNNRYFPEKTADENSIIIYFKDKDVLCKAKGDFSVLKNATPGKANSSELFWSLPTFKELSEKYTIAAEKLIYLFSMDGTDDTTDSKQDFFLLKDDKPDIDVSPAPVSGNFCSGDFTYIEAVKFRSLKPLSLSFAIITAFQLYNWYNDNVYCGRCSGKLMLDRVERMLKCPDCSNMIYPKISPGVIVGVMDKGRILLTKYAKKGYNRYALVAGFTEIGETLEETAKREVMEEVGLKIKNIKFYKSQPWSPSSSLLAGFFAEVDGDDTITLEKDELKEATWFYPEEIVKMSEGVSLTEEMINAFADSKIK